jgi:hypothetical protein
MQDLAPLLGRPKRGTNLPIVLSTVTAVLICAALVSNGSRQPNELLTIYMPPYQSLHGGGASLANSNLMEEGSIKLDPNSANPSADFYANADDAGSDDDVMDAGPGGVCTLALATCQSFPDNVHWYYVLQECYSCFRFCNRHAFSNMRNLSWSSAWLDPA